MGGKDPGVYINEGIQIAQRGTFVYEDPVVASVPAFARDLFFPSHQQRTTTTACASWGFSSRIPTRGTVVGQFPHLFPASIAIGYGTGRPDRRAARDRRLGDPRLARRVLRGRAAGRPHGGRGRGAALLALHVIEVWFARYPNAEVVMQALLFAALLATARAHVDGDPFFAPVAAALLGLLLFLRFDAVLGDRGRARRRWSLAGPDRRDPAARVLRSWCSCCWHRAGRRSTCSARCARTSACRSCSSATSAGGSTSLLGAAALGRRAARRRRRSAARSSARFVVLLPLVLIAVLVVRGRAMRCSGDGRPACSRPTTRTR